MIRIGSVTDIGMNRISSDWLGMNFIPIPSPGQLRQRNLVSNFFASKMIFFN